MEDTLTILIATDNHLGYAEKDALRANDSFETFEEILRIARERDVDCLLLGGDLFHDNRPSRRTLHRTLELLRHYCMGSRPCPLQLLSDPSVNFPSKWGTVNYEDPNYNIALPVFAIHGNHDDPTGEGNLSSLDLLATAGLLNYFGKAASVDDITMTPILLQKGTTRLALYGLGAVRDERLHRTFLQRKVKMLRPPEADDWFSMLVLHQNRVAHGPTGYIPEHFLDEFLDLVIWGHEHECQACEPTTCPQRGFTVCQPGSSVATSLSEGETRGKHVVILEVTGKQMRLLPVPLSSVRPFVMRDIALREATPRLDTHDARGVTAYLTAQVEQMISLAEREWISKQATLAIDQQRPMPLPLIRLRVDYAAEMDAEGFASAYAISNPQRFGQQFINRIANPRDVVHFIRRRAGNQGGASGKGATKQSTESNVMLIQGRTEAMRVEDLIGQFLASQRLDLLPQNEFSDIVRMAVEKDDRDAIEAFVKSSLERTLGAVPIGTILERDSLRGEFERWKRLREDEWTRLHPSIEALMASRPLTRMEREMDQDEDRTEGESGSEHDRTENDENIDYSLANGSGRRRSATASTRGRGGRTRASTRGRSIVTTGTTAKSTSTLPTALPSPRRQTLPGTVKGTGKQARLEFTIDVGEEEEEERRRGPEVAEGGDEEEEEDGENRVPPTPQPPKSTSSRRSLAPAAAWPPRRR